MAEGPPCHGNRAQEVNPEDVEASMPVRDPSTVVSQPPPLQEQPKSAAELNKTPQEQAIDEKKEPEKEDKVEEDDFIPYSDDDYYYPDEDEDEDEDEEEEDEDQPQQEEGKGGGGVEGGHSSDEKGKQLYSTDSFTFNRAAFEMIKRPYKDIEESSNPPESAKKMKEEYEKDAFLEGLMIDVNGEIAFLNNLIEYHTRNMVYPFEDFLSLDDYIKEWLKVDVPKDKLMEKITWLKRKYMEEAEKTTASGPREQEAIELCKKIWGTSDERAAGGDSPIINLTSLIKSQSESTFDFDDGGKVKVKRMKEQGATSGDKDPVMKFLERLAGDDVNADVSFLNELIEYHSNNLIYPFEHFIALDDFIKDWLKVDVPKDKMRAVIDGLKRKYGKEVDKMGKITDLGPQQQKAIDLVKKIWPDEIGTQTKEDEDVNKSPKDGSEHDST